MRVSSMAAAAAAMSLSVFAGAPAWAQSAAAGPSYYEFNDKNELLRPKDYRTWVFAGTGTTPSSVNPNALFPDFQNVYIDPESFKFWKENGYFREGTILVKELVRQGESNSPVGRGFYQGEAYSVAATVKDSKRYPAAPGGWEYFNFVDHEKGVLTKSSRALGGACIACHSLAKAGNGPFVELFMPLRDAKGTGKNSPENLDTRAGLKPGKPAEPPAKQ